MDDDTLFGDEESTAVLSDDELYRYHLSRRWADGPLMPFLMCNPSKADADINDPTIVRCCGFARRLGFAGMEALNAYAWRATKPTDLWAAQRAGRDIVGPDNDRWLTELFDRAYAADIPVVAAWGVHPKPARVEQVLALPHADRLRSFGVTQAGQPRHPLMLRGDTPLVPWPPAPSEPLTLPGVWTRMTLSTAAEHHPGDYLRVTGKDPRWAGVRGQIAPRTFDGHRLVDLAVKWKGETYGIRYMWRPDDPTHPTLRTALDQMVIDLDGRIPGGEAPGGG